MKQIDVVAAIIQKDGRIFATQRGYGDWKDWWEFPGGKIEAGETPEEALKREIEEELSTEINVDKFLCTVEYDYPTFHLTMHCYFCSLLKEALHLNEHEAAKWLQKDELYGVKWLPADVQVIDALRKNGGISQKRKIYVASSWRNGYYSEVVAKLREAGHEVYDFRNPPSGDPGFKWSSVSNDYMEWSPQQYRDLLQHEKAVRQFHNDIEAMEACDTCVLVLPCGRSAHTEAGWFAGKGRTTIAYIPERQEPELMYKLFSSVCCSIDELIETLK